MQRLLITMQQEKGSCHLFKRWMPKLRNCVRILQVSTANKCHLELLSAS
uniref:Uncharacterized protein n=1 Tax=Rhizophora mucronata TaxID=61149 RepID=A0A2P2NLB6_RHIMU